eukprot:888978_1
MNKELSSHQLKSWSFIHLLMETQKDKNVHGQMPRINQGTALAAMAFYLLFKVSVWRLLYIPTSGIGEYLVWAMFRNDIYRLNLADKDACEQWRDDESAAREDEKG